MRASSALLITFALGITVAFGAACAPRAPGSPEVASDPSGRSSAVSAPSPTPPAPSAAASASRSVDVEAARSRADQLSVLWEQAPRFDAAELPRWLSAHRVERAELERLFEALTADCLASPDPKSAACAALSSIDEAERPMHDTLEALVEMLAEVVDPSPAQIAQLAILVRLDARGLYAAGDALARVMQRRLAAALPACAPPSAAEVAAERAALTDFMVVERRAGGPQIRVPLAVRRPSGAELDDLALFYAAVAREAGVEVDTAVEDRKAPALAADSPVHASRAALASTMTEAHLRGDLSAYLEGGLQYLSSFGYPGPLRLAEESDVRWGGLGLAFVMRSLALTAEIVGRYPLAETLYRRAAPGGGACGTSTPSRRDDQVAGVVRAAELGRGCRAAAAERLFAIELDLWKAHGPERLGGAGLDVPRLYRGALLASDRDDAAALRLAFAAAGRAGVAALARLDRLGPESWASRVRAIPGYAATAGGASVEALTLLAQRGDAVTRREVARALGLLLEDRGKDPCIPGRGFGFRTGSSKRERRVLSVMTSCSTRVAEPRIRAVVAAFGSVVSDADPEVRRTVAEALGRIGSPLGRAPLARLATDPWESGTICTTPPDGAERCEPHYPVRRAAQEAAERIGAADRERATDRALRAEASGRRK